MWKILVWICCNTGVSEPKELSGEYSDKELASDVLWDMKQQSIGVRGVVFQSSDVVVRLSK